MEICNLEVEKGLVAKGKAKKEPQLIQVSASTADITSQNIQMEWYNVDSNDGSRERFATATVYCGDLQAWLHSWAPMAHLVEARMASLEDMARNGSATRFSRNMAYTLWANNLVDYTDKYRGMQAVVLNGLEAYAEVKLTEDVSGTWTVPPFFIDSACHLAGFVMNVSDAIDTAKNFCVTPGWGSMRFARPLLAGQAYRSYVKMIPTADDPTVYLGDVYVLQGSDIIGMVTGMQFRRYPRILLNRFFSAPDSQPTGIKAQEAPSTRAAQPAPIAVRPAVLTPAPSEEENANSIVITAEATKTAPAQTTTAGSSVTSMPAPAPAKVAVSVPIAPAADSSSISSRAMDLLAEEIGVERAELQPDLAFANIGVDSLMSLVLSERFRENLGITVSSSVFLEYPTIGDLQAWLAEYYS